jgi:endoglucanase
MFTRIRAFLLALISAQGLSGADFVMKVTDKNYLDTQGFSVFLYDSTYHPVFVDQRNTAMEMILHGQRISTNGDVRLMPTPEQWDLVATLKGRHVDKANSRLTAELAFPTFDFSYTLEVTAEPGGVEVSINLDKPLPQKLVGRAGFNLEFLPSIYMGKAYLVDGTKAGIFPRTPNDPMTKVLPLPDEPKKAYYLEDWDKAKGYTQPLPFAEGKSITLGIDAALARVNVVSDTANLMLFDGRNRAQNGWFVLRSLIPSGKTTGAIIWHIRPGVIPNWTRPPMIAHSQVGYAPGFSKVAVLELDPKYNAPKTARVLRLTEDDLAENSFVRWRRGSAMRGNSGSRSLKTRAGCARMTRNSDVITTRTASVSRVLPGASLKKSVRRGIPAEGGYCSNEGAGADIFEATSFSAFP